MEENVSIIGAYQNMKKWPFDVLDNFKLTKAQWEVIEPVLDEYMLEHHPDRYIPPKKSNE